MDDPDLGAATLEDDGTGGGGGTGRSGGGSVETWLDDEEELEARRPRGVDKAGASSSAAPGGAQKCRAAVPLFESRPKKLKNPTTTTKRREAAINAAQFQWALKQPPVVFM